MLHRMISILSLLIICSPLYSANLIRSHDFGASMNYSADSKSAEIRSVRQGSPAAMAGLKQGDRVTRIDDQSLINQSTYDLIYGSIREKESLRLEVNRDGKQLPVVVNLQPLPKEKISGVDILYDEVRTTSGYFLRAIITKPAGATGKMPGLFLAPWLSCDSVESPFGPSDGTGKLLHALASRSGFVLFRVDRAGVGDSQGSKCSSLDFQTELDGYRAALAQFKTYDFVDRQRIYMIGLSNGGGYAPLLGVPENVKGYIVQGAWAKTWYEHMMEIERRRLELTGSTPGEINEQMKGFAEFYTEYLIHEKTPKQVIESKPQLKKLWYDEPEHQYGRPASFYQQLEELNLAAAWQKVNSPVLVIYGEYDWTMSRSDHQWIASIVNKNHPGRGKYVEIPRMDHGLTLQPDMHASFENFGGGKFDDSIVTLIIDWLHQQEQKTGT